MRSLLRFAAATLILIVGVSGCGEGGPARKTCFPVSGELFVQGQPAAGARVYFQPVDGSRPEEWTSGFPRATVAADGGFQPGTYGQQDGAPAGEYLLLVEWPAVIVGEGDEEPSSEQDKNGDRLGGRFMDPALSLLRVKVDVKPTTLQRIDLR